MPDYKEMYFKLAAKVADVVEILVKAQQEGERSCIEDKNKSEINHVNLKREAPLE